MQKILTIARREYFAMVATRAFLLSIAMMPILMFGSIVVSMAVSRVEETETTRLAIMDGSGKLTPVLKRLAEEHNRTLEEREGSESEQDDNPFGGRTFNARFEIESLPVQSWNDDLAWELSERVRKDELDAFAVIPDSVFEQGESPTAIRYFAEDSTFSDGRRWLTATVNEVVRQERLKTAGIDPAIVQQATLPVPVTGLGLVTKSADGTIESATEVNERVAIFLPFGIMMLMWMVIFLAAQPMLESVMEEKNERIAEVLLGSANPFQIMLGKLLGNVAGSLSIFAIYFTGAFLMARYKGWTDSIPFEIAPWFIAYQVLAVMLFSSVFMVVGSAAKQLKDAQAMLLPIWLLLMGPLFVWINVIQKPNGSLATWMSFFPPATPLMMTLRLATGATIPVWQPIAGLFLMLLTTLIVVWLAGRIFRVTIMWQGKTPKVKDLVVWAFR